ncbi:beta-galactosidase [Promicromonospora panici]|uniref:beta-galactosidase n=1 Tax=Promicromonospora panici TaxID=2219658 RepID=UPI00101C61D4|nr:beta-galactosidase [Promicromonospora panici]
MSAQHLNDGVLFGAAYYYEYHRPKDLGTEDRRARRLTRDLDLMVEAGFTVIRVGESVWSTWEPENGRFDLDWLQPVLDGAHERGIKVVLGTPTYAVPMWLARLYPEINVVRKDGSSMGWGARQEIDYTHPAFLFHAERIIRAVVARYARHPAVVGYQVDNEPGNEIFHNRQVFERFVDHLRTRYGSVERLNDEWGLTYWSHRLSTWAELWTPSGNAQPQYALAWRRFQAELTTDFIGWQADVVREYAREDQFVTTCISYERPTVQDDALTRELDVTAGNPYYRMRDHLALPPTVDEDDSWMTTGTWSLYATADRMYSSKQAPFLVTETNAQAIGGPWQHEPAYDGQWRQVAWALVSRGATMIEYWHWHTLPYGTETYWGGILPHSLEPGRVYQQLAALGAELRAAGSTVANLTPDADVALVWSNPSKWSLAEFPQIGGGAGPDRRGYHRIFDAFYRGAFDAGLQSRVVHDAHLTDSSPEAVAAEQPVLVAAGVTIADDAWLRWLERYAAAGGHLVLGIRTGYEDEEARARAERKPAHLSEAAGVFYDEFASIDTPLAVDGADGFDLPVGAHATSWVDGLQVVDADVLVRYDHPHFGRWPAVTTRAHGSGRVTTVGTIPDPALARTVLAWAVEHGGQAVQGGTTSAGGPEAIGGSQSSDALSDAPRWRPQAPSQTVTGATNPAGERVRFVHSWSWDPSTFVLPGAVRDVLSGEELGAGAELTLGPWDVRVLLEV